MPKLEAPTSTNNSKPLSPTLIGDLLRLFDVAVVLVMGVVIYVLYLNAAHFDVTAQYLVSILVAGLIASLLFDRFGVYAGDHALSKRHRIDRMLSAWAVTFAVLLAAAFALKISSFYSRVWATSWFFSTAILLTVGRLVLSRWILRWARKGRFANRTVIVGTGEQARRLAAHLRRRDVLRTRIVGFVDERADDHTPGITGQEDSLGGINELVDMIRSGLVDQVFIALPWNQARQLEDVVRRLAVTPVAIRLAPDLVGYDYPDRRFTHIAGLPMLLLFDRPISGWSRLIKALEDRALAAFFLIVLSPILLLIALAIKFDSPGPIFFKQPRYGFNNNLIEVWKFRTMHAQMSDSGGAVQAKKDDPRVTRLGRTLRNSSLDELPQLINVLRGDMSIVGPRPHPVELKAGDREFEDIVDQYAARHRVKPGITGWAQVNGWRGETDTEEKIHKRVEHDLYYIDNWSIWFDFLIIARTIAVLFKDEKAY